MRIIFIFNSMSCNQYYHDEYYKKSLSYLWNLFGRSPTAFACLQILQLEIQGQRQTFAFCMAFVNVKSVSCA